MIIEPNTWDDLGNWVWDSSNCEDLAQPQKDFAKWSDDSSMFKQVK